MSAVWVQVIRDGENDGGIARYNIDGPLVIDLIEHLEKRVHYPSMYICIHRTRDDERIPSDAELQSYPTAFAQPLYAIIQGLCTERFLPIDCSSLFVLL